MRPAHDRKLDDELLYRRTESALVCGNHPEDGGLTIELQEKRYQDIPEICNSSPADLCSLPQGQGVECSGLFDGAQAFDFEGVLYDFACTVDKNDGRLRALL